jgi:hypothetical protein
VTSLRPIKAITDRPSLNWQTRAVHLLVETNGARRRVGLRERHYRVRSRDAPVPSLSGQQIATLKKCASRSPESQETYGADLDSLKESFKINTRSYLPAFCCTDSLGTDNLLKEFSCASPGECGSSIGGEK